MSQALLVQAQNISKRYKLYSRASARLLEWLTLNRVKRHAEFWALRDLNLSVRRGQCLGVIGSNGAGKSTLLKILTGTLSPTTGSFEVHGKVLSLLELGTGFSIELTGRQNVIETARLLGFPDEYASSRIKDIADFAGLEDFFDRPIRTYSSGMLVRLAFSLYAFLDPDVFIIDEALAVGDAAFQRKCYRRLEQLIQDERLAVILVSHDTQAITRFCTDAVWLDHGQVRLAGPPADVIDAYLKHLFTSHGPTYLATAPVAPAVQAPSSSGDADLPPRPQRLERSEAAMLYPNSTVDVVGLWLEDGNGNPTATARLDEPFCLCYAMQFRVPAEHPVFGIRIATIRGDVLVAANTEMMMHPTSNYTAGQTAIVRWPLGPGLAAGDYFVSCGCSTHGAHLQFLCREVDAYQFAVVGQSRSMGLCHLAQVPKLHTA